MDLIQNVAGEPKIYMATDAEYAQTDEQINAQIPDALPGTIVSKAGYKAMKQKDHNGSWVSL